MVDDTLIVNGQPLSYTTHPAGEFAREIYEDPAPVLSTEQSPDARHWVLNLPSRAAVRDMPELTVPAGKYFLMGDSRDNSRDSRFFGFVDREQIVGRSPGVALSFDQNHMLLPRVMRWFSKFDTNLPE
jgi:signal peptidase I